MTETATLWAKLVAAALVLAFIVIAARRRK